MDGSGLWRAPQPGRVQQFGDACFDAAAQRLTVNGISVEIEQQPRALLALLLSRGGEMVSKEELLDTLWAGRIVTEASLTKCVGRLRAALGDGDHKLIRTVHGQGYRLDAPVTVQDRSDLAPAAAMPAAPAIAPPAAGVLATPAMAVASATAKLPRWLLVTAAGGCLLLLTFAVTRPDRPVRSPPPVPPQARALYMKGLQDWSERTPASLSHAVEEFTAALRLDPDYAQAEAGLASCYNLLPEFTAMPATQAYALAKGAATRAIALQPDLATAHAAYAFALFWGDWNFAEARREYDRALQLAPDNAAIHHWYATSLDALGAHDPALAQIERALELDPNSVAIRADRGLILFNGGRVKEAIAVLDALAIQAPGFLSTHHYLADIAFARGDDVGYLREELLYARQRHDGAGEAVALAAQQGQQAGGRAGFLRALLDARLAGYAAGTNSAADVASTYALLGDLPQALGYLSLAIDRHDECAIFLLNDPAWRPFRTNAAFARMLARLHLDRPFD